MRFITITFLIFTTCLVSEVLSQANTEPRLEFDTAAYYRLTNDYAGPGKALGISGNTVVMATVGSSYEQLWKLVSLGGNKYRLVNAAVGDGKSLDNRKSGDRYSVVMGTTGNYSGQFWTLAPQGNGKYRLSNDYAGPGNSLDSADMATTGDYSGQSWTLTKIATPSVAPVRPTTAPSGSAVVPVQPVPVITDPNKPMIIQTGPGIPVTPQSAPAGTQAKTFPDITYNNVIIPWDPNKIPKGGTMICSADLRASANCGFVKADWVGDHIVNLKCDKGFYDPIWGGTCWDLPKNDGNGTWVRGTTAVTADDAVWRAPKESLSTATRIKSTSLAWECTDGSFWDGLASGGAGCFQCPPDHPRRTANAVTSDRACASAANETAKAVFLGYNGCPKPDPGEMGLTGKRMPGKPFLDIGGGGCYSCPTSDEAGNILITERNANSVKSDGGCTLRFKWRSPDFPEPGMAGLIGVKEALLENLIFQNPDILTIYLTQVAKERGLQPGSDGSRTFVEQHWQQVAEHPYSSPDLSNMTFALLELAIKTPPETRSPAEKKLVASFTQYVTLRRTFIAEQALAMYDAWKDFDDKTREHRLQSRLEVIGFDYGTVPLDFHSAAAAGFGLGAIGAGTAAAIVGANEHALAIARITSEGVKAGKSLDKALAVAQKIETISNITNGMRAFRALSIATQLGTLGPAAVIEAVGIILQSIAIDQFIAIQTARDTLVNAVNAAKQPADLKTILDGPDGRDQLAYFWSKAMDVKTITDDPELVAKARAAMELARQRRFQYGGAQ